MWETALMFTISVGEAYKLYWDGDGKLDFQDFYVKNFWLETFEV